jgi:hypothetical protein
MRERAPSEHIQEPCRPSQRDCKAGGEQRAKRVVRSALGCAHSGAVVWTQIKAGMLPKNVEKYLKSGEL